MPSARDTPHAIIIPARNEEPCLAQVIAELRAVIGDEIPVAVGVNASTDRTADIARSAGALVAETDLAGYGHGCRAAVDLLNATRPVGSYIFFAGDGADDPRDIAALMTEQQRGAEMVLGCRTTRRTNWNLMNWHYVVANRAFGLLCGILTGRRFADLGPLRLIERQLFQKMDLREWTYGWTIEAQIRGVLLGARIVEIPVTYRQRLAGEQKVSHVSTVQTLCVAGQIVAAAVRTRRCATGPGTQAH